MVVKSGACYPILGTNSCFVFQALYAIIFKYLKFFMLKKRRDLSIEEE